MNKYIAPELEISRFDSSDVITTSEELIEGEDGD